MRGKDLSIQSRTRRERDNKVHPAPTRHDTTGRGWLQKEWGQPSVRRVIDTQKHSQTDGTNKHGTAHAVTGIVTDRAKEDTIKNM